MAKIQLPILLKLVLYFIIYLQYYIIQRHKIIPFKRMLPYHAHHQVTHKSLYSPLGYFASRPTPLVASVLQTVSKVCSGLVLPIPLFCFSTFHMSYSQYLSLPSNLFHLAPSPPVPSIVTSARFICVLELVVFCYVYTHVHMCIYHICLILLSLDTVTSATWLL